ncbi:MAG: hypothetical protein ACI8Y6_002712, partial [Brevundimonas sp.]
LPRQPAYVLAKWAPQQSMTIPHKNNHLFSIADRRTNLSLRISPLGCKRFPANRQISHSSRLLKIMLGLYIGFVAIPRSSVGGIADICMNLPTSEP